MAYISIDRFRLATGVGVDSLSDAAAGMFIGAASALMYSLTGRQLGHCVESLSVSGGDVEVLAYGHMLESSGKVMIGDSGSAVFDGAYEFIKLDEDRIRLVNAVLPVGVVSARLFPQYTVDMDILDNRLRPTPTPVAAIDEIRIDDPFCDDDAFDDDTIVPVTDYYVARDGDGMFNTEIELAQGKYSRVSKRRVPGYINPVRTVTRRLARVVFYAGTTRSVPMDLLVALSAISKQLATDPLGEFQSESFDYYSYSRRSLQDTMKFPAGALATIMRYAG